VNGLIEGEDPFLKEMGDLARILYRSILGMANVNKDFFEDK
jgi:hypothetical protein